MRLQFRWSSFLAVLSMVLSLAACGERQTVSPVVVMTQDLGTGADLEAVLAATTADVPALVDAMWAERGRSSFAARAATVAEGIALFNPDLVGVQSAIQWRQQVPASAAPADEVVSDHLELLLAAMSARGLVYDPVAIVTTADLELTGASGNDYRLIDREVILASRAVKTESAAGATFGPHRTFSTPAGSVDFLRGWAAVSAKRDGKTFRFMSAHLDSSPAVQRDQARQLAALVPPDVATLVVGSLAEETTSAYSLLLTGPLVLDAAARAGAGLPSCCRDVALVDPSARLVTREDFVLGTAHFHVGWGSWAQGNGAPMVGGLWPSRHAGIAAGVWLE